MELDTWPELGEIDVTRLEVDKLLEGKLFDIIFVTSSSNHNIEQ